MPSLPVNFAVVGATGVVGQELLKILAERGTEPGRVRVLASERSAGRRVAYDGAELELGTADENAFGGVDVAFFAAGGDIARALAPAAVEAGAMVIDKSSYWRMQENVPLVVPEVNGEDIRTGEGIIACPNCSTIPVAMVLQALRQEAGVERVHVATYQSASGGGRDLLDELEEQTRDIAAGRRPQARIYPRQLAHNVVPGGWKLETDGYNEEEMKLAQESRKILHDPALRLAATCVRVPVPVGHGEALFVETSRPLGPERARELLAAAPGMEVVDDGRGDEYPTPADAAGRDEVLVGRIRRDLSRDNGLALWVVSDNLRKGAALNAIQIAERAHEMGLV
jgi:aspartate-semialdehyde dehydrogenase